jgi:4-hydroxythreonine-4-phosphate dehydrogenase
MMGSSTHKPRIAITMGDPAGVGPEITLKAVRHPEVLELCTPVIIGDRNVLDIAARVLSQDGDTSDGTLLPEGVKLIDLKNVAAERHAWGKVTAEAGKAAAEYIEHAVDLALKQEIAGIVTGPINKEAIALANVPYPGHTEMLAALTNTTNYAMMLAGPTLRVIHVSTHVSLLEAIGRVKQARILKVIEMAYRVLKGAGIAEPSIAVAGLNPHAGEGGLFGDEEIREIIPAIEAAKAQGIRASGPHPPDTVFWHASQRKFDIVVVMYHDQGHIPAKLAGFDKSVNITVGLPVIRTSVDHGTAFDIAGRGIASETSMVEALRHAVVLAAVPAR